MNYEIRVIGNEALLFPFLQFGFTTYAPPSEQALRDYLEQAAAEQCGIIYIEDALCFQVKDILDKYRDSPTPIVIPIGENQSGDSYSQRMVKEMMEKAIGRSVI